MPIDRYGFTSIPFVNRKGEIMDRKLILALAISLGCLLLLPQSGFGSRQPGQVQHPIAAQSKSDRLAEVNPATAAVSHPLPLTARLGFADDRQPPHGLTNFAPVARPAPCASKAAINVASGRSNATPSETSRAPRRLLAEITETSLGRPSSNENTGAPLLPKSTLQLVA